MVLASHSHDVYAAVRWVVCLRFNFLPNRTEPFGRTLKRSIRLEDVHAMNGAAMLKQKKIPDFRGALWQSNAIPAVRIKQITPNFPCTFPLL
jgi:hypothetical protein